jgi:hypothetical protein
MEPTDIPWRGLWCVSAARCSLVVLVTVAAARLSSLDGAHPSADPLQHGEGFTRLSVSCRLDISAYMLQVKINGNTYVHVLPCVIIALEPASLVREDSSVATCRKASDPASPARRALVLLHVLRL